MPSPPQSSASGSTIGVANPAHSPKPPVHLTTRPEPRPGSPDSVLNDSSDALADITDDVVNTARVNHIDVDDESGSSAEVRDTSPCIFRETDDARDESDEGDEEEDEAEGVFDVRICDSPAMTGSSRHVTPPEPNTLAPSLKPHPFLPGVYILDVPSLRLDGPCYRSCCVPNATREWLRLSSKKTPLLTPALVPGGDPVAVFGVPEQSAVSVAGFETCVETEKMWVKLGGVKNNAVKAAFKTAGFRVLKETEKAGESVSEASAARDEANVLPTKPQNFNVSWNGDLRKSDFAALTQHQRVNHFPGTWELGRKDKLGKNVAKARRRRPDDFDIHPKSFLLPKDLEEWRSDRARDNNNVYIVKPPASSRGRGVRMLKPDETSSIEKKKVLIQRYIKHPHLLDGYKYDLRVYVVVTSIDPLKVFLYKEGLVRLATEKYTENGTDLSKRCMHLTNYSVNVKKKEFTMGASAVGEDDVGFKRSVSSLRRKFEAENLDWHRVWVGVKDIVTKTMVSVEGAMNARHKREIPSSARNACYELFGFDIMLDQHLKPWLIEVNTGPSLSAPTNLDQHIKHKMVSNLFNLVGIAPYDKNKARQRRYARLTGVPTTATTRVSVSASSGLRPPSVSRLTSVETQRGQKNPHKFSSRPNTPAPETKAVNCFPSKRDARSLRGLDFSKYAMEALPQVIRDAEGELCRQGEFERCFPTDDPTTNTKYLDLFETTRYDNALLCAWEGYKARLRNGGNFTSGDLRPSRVFSRAGSANGGSRYSRNGAVLGNDSLRRERKKFVTTPVPSSEKARRAEKAPSSPQSFPGIAADIDALAASLARRLGVDSNSRVEQGHDSLSFRATGLLSSAASRNAHDAEAQTQPKKTFVRDMVRSASRGSRGAAPTKAQPPSRDQLAALGILGSGGGHTQVQVLADAVLARATRR